MALMDVKLTNPDYTFAATDVKDHTVQIDIPEDQGGHGEGFRPMQMLLAALGGCSGVDIVSILKKQRQPLKGLNIKIDGEREKGKEPSVWESVTIVFEFSGELEASKAFRAAELSINKYCSVAETLRRAGATFNWSVTLNGEAVSF